MAFNQNIQIIILNILINSMTVLQFYSYFILFFVYQLYLVLYGSIFQDISILISKILQLDQVLRQMSLANQILDNILQILDKRTLIGTSFTSRGQQDKNSINRYCQIVRIRILKLVQENINKGRVEDKGLQYHQGLVKFYQQIIQFVGNEKLELQGIDKLQESYQQNKHKIGQNLENIIKKILTMKQKQFSTQKVSLLLNSIVQKIQKNIPFNKQHQILNEIKNESIKIPLTKLINFLNDNNIYEMINGLKQIGIYQQQQQGTLAQNLKLIKKQSQENDEIVFHQFQREVQRWPLLKITAQIITRVCEFTNEQSLRNKSNKTKKDLEYLKQRFDQRIVQCQTLHLKQIQRLKHEIQTYSLFDRSLKEEIFQKDSKIKQLTQSKKGQKQNSQDVNLLKAQLQKVKQQRNNLLNQLQALKDNLHDKQIAMAKEYQTKLKEETQKIKKHAYSQKAKEIDKIQAKRRAQKTKLSNEFQQIFQELQELKVKYYTEIGAKLCKSRMDMSMSLMMSDKGVGNSFLLQNMQNIQDMSILNNSNNNNNDVTQQMISQLQEQYKKQFQLQIQKISKENNYLQQEIKQKEIYINAITLELEQEKSNSLELSNKLEATFKLLQEKEQQLKIITANLVQLVNAKKNYESHFKSLTQSNNNGYSIASPALIPFQRTLFMGNIFQHKDSQKQILISHIQDYMSKSIIKTQPLYKYDPNNKTNFHTYLDNKTCITCVIKTSKTIICGFYPGELNDTQIMNKGGLIICVTNNQSYRLQQKNERQVINYRGMTYDPYYIIYGNAEIRLKSGEKLVFSNFGIQNAYFDYGNRSRKVGQFLNDGDNRQVEFEYCQFYQLYFQEQEILNKIMDRNHILRK